MLFKYLPIERLDVIEKLSIRFSPFKSLNDPFESFPLIQVPENTDGTFDRMLADNLKGMDDIWENALEEERTPKNKSLFENSKIDLASELREKSSPHSLGLGLVEYLKHLCVLSLSRTNSNILMWSHYASNHEGYIIGFNDSHAFLNRKNPRNEIVKPKPVIYSTKRPIRNENESMCLDQLFCKKSIEWAYEEEERIFLNHIDNLRSSGKDKYGMDIELTDIPIEAISSIYLGCNSTKDTEKRILNALKNYNVSIPVFKGSISKSEYRIEFKRL